MDRNEELVLHGLVIAKDDLALAKLYDLYSESIIVHLKIHYSDVANKDIALVLEAVNEAFLGYYRNPLTFDISKGSLKHFLKIAAERDLINILDKEKKHSAKINSPIDVELEENFWNSILKNTQSADERIINKEILELIDKELTNHFSNVRDIQLVKLMLQGIRKTEPFAEILQLKGLGKGQQRIEVKRHKDRITKVMERSELVSKLKRILQ